MRPHTRCMHVYCLLCICTARPDMQFGLTAVLCERSVVGEMLREMQVHNVHNVGTMTRDR